MEVLSLEMFWQRLVELLSYDAMSPMIFSSGTFLFLFAIFITIYGRLREAPTLRILYVIAF